MLWYGKVAITYGSWHRLGYDTIWFGICYTHWKGMQYGLSVDNGFLVDPTPFQNYPIFNLIYNLSSIRYKEHMKAWAVLEVLGSNPTN